MSSTLTVRRIVADGRRVSRTPRPSLRGCARRSAGGRIAERRNGRGVGDCRAAVSDESTTFLLAEGHPAGMIGAYFDNTPDRRAFVSELWVARGASSARRRAAAGDGHRLARRAWWDVYAWIADANRNAIRLRAGGFRQYRRTRADRTDARRDEIAVRIADEADVTSERGPHGAMRMGSPAGLPPAGCARRPGRRHPVPQNNGRARGRL